MAEGQGLSKNVFLLLGFRQPGLFLNVKKGATNWVMSESKLFFSHLLPMWLSQPWCERDKGGKWICLWQPTA